MEYKALALREKINNIKRLLFIVLSLTYIFVFPIYAGTTNHYFANNGSDLNAPCTSPNSPCKTLNKAQIIIDSKSSDDTVNLYFNRGDTWTVDSYCSGRTPCKYGVWGLNVEDSDPIVNIDAYGSGYKPVFDGLVSDFSDSTVPSHDPTNGPFEWSVLFRFKKDYCSVKNLEIKNMYGSVIDVGGVNDYADYFTAEGNTIYNYGKNAFYASAYYGTRYSKFTKNLIYDGGQLYIEGKAAARSWGIAISVAPWDGRYRSAIGNTISYNVIYDISGEILHGTGSTIEYNILGDSGSIAIYIYGNQSNMENTIVRYNLVTMSDWNTSIYDELPNISPEGIIITDELDGGDNSGATIEVYGNIVINRKMGIGFNDYHGWDTEYGEVRIYNNTAIDNHLYNYYIGNYNKVTSGKGFIYNNLSILYNQTSSTHALDHNNPTDLSTYWTIHNNAYWTTGGNPIVDSDWKTNYVVTNPQLAGEEQGSPVDWVSQNGGDPREKITFANVTPNSNSALINTGKLLGAGFEKRFLTHGTDFSKLPDTPTFQLASQPESSKWSIGAIVVGGNPIGVIAAPQGLVIKKLQ